MTKLNTIVAELSSLSQYNPVFKSKIKEFESLLWAALVEKKIDESQYAVYKEIIPKQESGLNNIKLFINLSTQNYYPHNYDMLNFLDTRTRLYELNKKLHNNSISFSSGFQQLLFDLNNAMDNNSENFWDLYFVLLVCLYANYNLYEADIINQNKKEILIIIKYAAEGESRLLTDLSNRKMKLFAEIFPDIGKDNVTKFYLVKTLFTNKSNHINMLKELAKADKMYLSQYRLTEVLCSNHVKLNNYYSPRDIIELCLINKVLADNLWLFDDRKSEILDYMSYLFSYLIDQLFYTFIIHMIFLGKSLDGVYINTVTTLQWLLANLHKYCVETYAVEELERFIMTKKE